MFRNNYLILFASIAAILVACGTPPPSNNTQFSVVIDPTQNTEIRLSDYFVLDTIVHMSGALVGSIDNLIPTTNGYVVQGASDRGELLAFSPDGAFQRQLIQIGRGPNEAINIVDVAHDNNGKLLILTNFGQQIAVYSPVSKRIERTITLPAPYIARNIEKLDSIRYVLYKDLSYSDEQEYKISIFNEQTGQVEHNFLPLDKKSTEYISFIQRNNLFRNADGIVCFYEAFCDTVYRVKPTAIEPFLSFDKGEFGMPERELNQGFGDVMQFVDFCKGSSRIWAHLNCYQCGDLFVSTYNYRDQTYLNVADISTGRSVSGTTINDDLVLHTTYPAERLPIVGTNSEYLYLSAVPTELKESLQDNRFAIDSAQGLCLVRLKIKTR